MTLIADIRDLDARLAAAGDPAKKAWWERYLKGVIDFYGVGIPDIRTIVADWRQDRNLVDADGDQLMQLATTAVALPMAEDKLAAIILLQEHGLDRLAPDRHLAQIAGWFDDGHVADWNTCDWLCVRVLGPTVSAHGRAAAEQVAGWTDAPGLWRRRAAKVAFVNLAPAGDASVPGLTELVLGACHRTASDPQRFAQTATGWVLRELSKADPAPVVTYVDQHLAQMSREAIRMATAKLPDHVRRDLLHAHNGNADVRGRHAGR